MIVQTHAPASSNIGGAETFKIEARPEMFALLSSGLYSNKIRAVIRELSTNAYDSVVAAGNGKNFVVHSPSRYKPLFYVRDYGTGLSEEDVYDLYTSYGSSNKRDSNLFNGCLGVGSKSPFSYVDMFTVESFYNGTKHSFVCFSENGIPKVTKTGSESTDEENGLKVSIPVREGDVNKFIHEIDVVLSMFEKTPEVINYPGEVRKSALIDKVEYGKASIFNNPFYGVKVWMGNVLYDASGIDDDVISAYNNGRDGVFVKAKIGDINFAASREHVTKDPATIKFIRDAIVSAENEVFEEVREALQKGETVVECLDNAMKCNDYGKYSVNRLRKVINEEVSKEIKKRFNGKMFSLFNYSYNWALYSIDSLGFVKLSYTNASGKKIKDSKNIEINSTTAFMLVDDQKFVNVAQEAYVSENMPECTHVIRVYADEKDYDEVMKELKQITSKVFKLSDAITVYNAIKPPKKKRNSTKKTVVDNYTAYSYLGKGMSYSVFKLKQPEQGHYVVLFERSTLSKYIVLGTEKILAEKEDVSSIQAALEAMMSTSDAFGEVKSVRVGIMSSSAFKKAADSIDGIMSIDTVIEKCASRRVIKVRLNEDDDILRDDYMYDLLGLFTDLDLSIYANYKKTKKISSALEIAGYRLYNRRFTVRAIQKFFNHIYHGFGVKVKYIETERYKTIKKFASALNIDRNMYLDKCDAYALLDMYVTGKVIPSKVNVAKMLKMFDGKL